MVSYLKELRVFRYVFGDGCLANVLGEAGHCCVGHLRSPSPADATASEQSQLFFGIHLQLDRVNEVCSKFFDRTEEGGVHS